MGGGRALCAEVSLFSPLLCRGAFCSGFLVLFSSFGRLGGSLRRGLSSLLRRKGGLPVRLMPPFLPKECNTLYTPCTYPPLVYPPPYQHRCILGHMPPYQHRCILGHMPPNHCSQEGICLLTTVLRREYASQDRCILGYMPPRTGVYWLYASLPPRGIYHPDIPHPPYHPGYTTPSTRQRVYYPVLGPVAGERALGSEKEKVMGECPGCA